MLNYIQREIYIEIVEVQLFIKYTTNSNIYVEESTKNKEKIYISVAVGYKM